MRLAFLLFSVLSLTFLSQIQAQSQDEELVSISQSLQLTKAQQLRVSQLINNRDQALESIEVNSQYDELQRSQKRSSIVAGFEHSVLLLLNQDQKELAYSEIAVKRKEKALIIERMKKAGHTQSEIVEYLNKESKVKSIHE